MGVRFPPIYSDFNSRPCERGDVHKLTDTIKNIISIHAPARGATAADRD